MLAYLSPTVTSSLTPVSDVTALISPLIAVSPHYDDAVFSCGDLLYAVPKSTVMTVYTGCPKNPDLLTDWDRRCKFSCAR